MIVMYKVFVSLLKLVDALVSCRGLFTNCSSFPHLSPVPLSASELSLTEVRDKVPPLRRLDPGLMPLPDTACGLEWSSLVVAAKAYEGEEGDSSVFQLFNLRLRLHPY